MKRVLLVVTMVVLGCDGSSGPVTPDSAPVLCEEAPYAFPQCTPEHDPQNFEPCPVAPACILPGTDHGPIRCGVCAGTPPEEERCYSTSKGKVMGVCVSTCEICPPVRPG